MRVFREMAIIAFAGIALLYLFLPSLVPDFVPLVGWIDEGIATTILLSALQHWGIDLTGLFGNQEKQKNEQLADEVIITDRLSDGSSQKIRIPREVLERAMAEYQQEQAYLQQQQNQQQQYRR